MLHHFLYVLAFSAASLAAPISVHSHNDYLQDTPLMTALNLGVMSVEADLFWRDNQLFVAHTTIEINPSRTFASLYIDPIVDIIEGRKESPYPITPENPLQLLIEFKTDGASTYDPVIAALEPLRSKGYLTTFKDGKLTQGAVTAVGTGNTPLNRVLAASPRDFFFDAPIQALTSSSPAPGMQWSPEISPLASTDFAEVNGVWGTVYTFLTGLVLQESHEKFVKLIADAHARNIKTRFWNALDRDGVYLELIKDGSDWLNADDLPKVKRIIEENS